MDETMDLHTAEFYIGLQAEVRPIFQAEYEFFRRNPRQALSTWYEVGQPTMMRRLAEDVCISVCPDHPVCAIFKQ